jgi:hypothetical protein
MTITEEESYVLLIALESNSKEVAEHAAKYLHETYGFIVLTRATLTASGASEAKGLETFLKAFTQSRHRKVTSREEARQIGRQLHYKPNSKGQPTAVPLGFDYYEDHAGIILCAVADDDVLRTVRDNEGSQWLIFDHVGMTEGTLTGLRTGDKLILHTSSPERLNTALSLALGGESIVNTIDDTPALPVHQSIVDQIKGKD